MKSFTKAGGVTFSDWLAYTLDLADSGQEFGARLRVICYHDQARLRILYDRNHTPEAALRHLGEDL